MPQPASNPQPIATQLAMEHMLSLTRSASALYAGTGSVHHEMLRRAATLQREVAGELARAVHPGEVLNVQAALAVAGWQQAVDYSRALADCVRSSLRAG